MPRKNRVVWHVSFYSRPFMVNSFIIGGAGYCTAANPWVKSARISSMCSVPIDRRMVLGRMPQAASSSADSCEWVVEAGWITRDFTSATLASSENSFKLSVNFFAVSASPLISKVKIEPAPCGKYRSYSCFAAPVASDGWLTRSTPGCFC